MYRSHTFSFLFDGITFALLYEQSNTRTRAYENNNSHLRYIKFNGCHYWGLNVCG